MPTVNWTINDQPISAEAIKASNPVVRFESLACDTLTWNHEVDDFAGDTVISEGTVLTLKRNGVVWFIGTIREEVRLGSPASQNISYVAKGFWEKFERKAYLQTWQTPVNPSDPNSALVPAKRGRVVIGQGDNAAKVSLATFLSLVISYVGFTPDVDLGGDVFVPYDEVTDYSSADVMCRALQWAPDAVCWFNYATSTCYVRRRAALERKTIALGGGTIGAGGVSLRQRRDMLINNVAIFYIATNRENAATWETTSLESYPSGTTGEEDNCFVRTLKLAGSVNDSSYLSQQVDVDPLSPALDTEGLVHDDDPDPVKRATFDSLHTFWKKKHPWLVQADISVKSFRSGARKRVPAPGEAENGETTTPTEGLRELVKGALTDWMIEENASLKTEQQTVSVIVYYEQADKDDETKKQRLSHRLETSIVATNAQTKTYTVLESATSAEPEARPPGLAYTVWAMGQQIHFDGTVQVQEEEASDVASIGNVLCLSEGRPEWEMMDALIQSRTVTLATGVTDFVVGPPRQLGIDSLVDIFKCNRSRQPVTSSYSRATGSSAAQRRQTLPRWQTIPPAQSGTQLAPRNYTAVLDVAGKMPVAAEFVIALQGLDPEADAGVYNETNDPIYDDTISFEVSGAEKFRGRVTATAGTPGFFTIPFLHKSINYYVKIAQIGMYP